MAENGGGLGEHSSAGCWALCACWVGIMPKGCSVLSFHWSSCCCTVVMILPATVHFHPLRCGLIDLCWKQTIFRDESSGLTYRQSMRCLYHSHYPDISLSQVLLWRGGFGPGMLHRSASGVTRRENHVQILVLGAEFFFRISELSCQHPCSRGRRLLCEAIQRLAIINWWKAIFESTGLL